MTTIKKGSKGGLVKALQYILGVEADGVFGSKTQDAVKSWQKANGLTADGIVGANTWTKLVSKAPTLRSGSSGAWVYAVETLLTTMKLDGKFTAEEVAFVKAYQTASGLSVDGVVGKNTYSRLFGLTSATSNTVTTNNGTNSKQPVDYKQYDSRWGSVIYTKNNTYNKSQTIKNSGCGITAMADIIATWWDKNITPKQTAADAVSHGYRTTNSGTSWSYFEYVAKKYGASKFVQTSSFATMQACLAAGGYVVVSFKQSKWTNGGHFCTLWKDDGKYIYVNDPASSSSSRAKGTYSEVKSAAKQYFCFYK